MDYRPLGSCGISCSRLAWGAFKIGRDEGTKFPDGYTIPSEDDAIATVHEMLDLGITFIDTAPSYGLSEARLGRALADRREDVVLATKVGEQFIDGRSHHDFSSTAAVKSLHESLRRLGTDHVDLLLVHSDGDDRAILEDEEYIETLRSFRSGGLTRAIGFSGKTTEGNRRALDWSDAIMVEYHLDDRSHEPVITEAADRGVGVIVKKALRSGHLPAANALEFLFHDSPVADGITSVMVGSLSGDRMRENAAVLRQ